MSTARSLRRAAERRAVKLARKEANNGNLAPDAHSLDTPNPDQTDIPPSEPCTEIAPHPKPVSEARLIANRNNAQHSPGPRTDEGKARSSKNALKTALTGRTVLLPGDDADRYTERLAGYEQHYQPVGVREIENVQAMCDAWWRLERIPRLIEAIYLKGASELKDRVKDVDPAARNALLRAEIYIVYERQFLNLQIQEQRLYRHAQKLKAELWQLQKERLDRDSEQYASAAMLYIAAKKDRKPFHPSDLGFEFSTDDIETYLAARRAGRIAGPAFPDTPDVQHNKQKAA